MDNYTNNTSTNQNQQNSNGNYLKTSWSILELLQAELPEPEWAVDGLIPIGLSSLGGRPKIGKSLFSLQLASAKASGSSFLGRNVSQGSVLYIALEDSPIRLQTRIRRQNILSDLPIQFELKWPGLQFGGLDMLMTTMEENKYSLIIIDTISRLLGRLDQLDNGVMNSIFGDLQRASLENLITLLLLDHFRKQNGADPDPIEDLLGSTGKSAPLDTILGLYRERGKHNATLIAKGRDIEDQTINLGFDQNTWTWKNLGMTNIPQPNSRKGKILAAISVLVVEGILPTPTQIAEKVNENVGNVGHDLSELVAEGLLIKGEKIGKEQPYYISEDYQTK